jgi:hypothetical protein
MPTPTPARTNVRAGVRAFVTLWRFVLSSYANVLYENVHYDFLP